MKRKRNSGAADRYQTGDKISCENTPPWYDQLIRLPESKRKEATARAMEKLKDAKPNAVKFIENTKSKLVGIQPNVSYGMPDNRENSLDVTYVHDFSQVTLLFWCPQGEFGFFINASLKYDNGVKGFTY